MTVKKIVFREASLGSVESLLLNLRLQSHSRIKTDVHEGTFSQKRTPTFSLSEILIFSTKSVEIEFKLSTRITRQLKCLQKI